MPPGLTFVPGDRPPPALSPKTDSSPTPSLADPPSLVLDERQASAFIERVERSMGEIQEQMRRTHARLGPAHIIAGLDAERQAELLPSGFSVLPQDLTALPALAYRKDGDHPPSFASLSSVEKLHVLAYGLAMYDGPGALGVSFSSGGRQMRTPGEVLEGGLADCDEMALLLYALARHLRLPEADRMALVSVWGSERGVAHTNLLVSPALGPDGTWTAYVLDPLLPMPMSTLRLKDASAEDPGRSLRVWELAHINAAVGPKDQIIRPQFALCRHPSDYYHIWKADGLLRTGRADLLAQAEAELLQCTPSNARALLFLSRAQFFQGPSRRADAERTLRRSMATGFEDADSYSDAGTLFEAMGLRREAFDALSRASLLDPSLSSLRPRMAALALGLSQDSALTEDQRAFYARRHLSLSSEVSLNSP